MRYRTVAALSAIAVTATSLVVASLTPGADAVAASPVTSPDSVAVATSQAAVANADEEAAKTWSFVAGDALEVQGRLGHPKLANGKRTDTYLYLKMAPSKAKAPKNKTSMFLAIAIDRSGSMKGKRLENALAAARGMIRRLRDGDVVSVVSYDTRATRVVAPTTVTASNREDLAKSLDQIKLGGDTCISCALEASLDALTEAPAGRPLVKRILLLSDGQATSGVKNVEGFRAIAARARDAGVNISSVGVDVDYNEKIMAAVAQESNGNHYFVENVAGLGTVFEQEFESLVSTIATDTEVRVKLAPGVRVMQVFDRPFRREGDTLVIPMGTFSAKDEKTLLVKLRLDPKHVGELPVAEVLTTFQNLASHTQSSSSGTLAALITDDITAASTLDPDVEARLARSETAAALREANRLASIGRSRQAVAVITKHKKHLSSRRGRVRAAPKPAPMARRLDNNFEDQMVALGEAEKGFAAVAAAPAARPARGGPSVTGGSAGPRRPAPAPPTRRSKAASRRSAADAFEMGL